jgi:hypothetical protein
LVKNCPILVLFTFSESEFQKEKRNNLTGTFEQLAPVISKKMINSWHFSHWQRKSSLYDGFSHTDRLKRNLFTEL